MHNNYLYHVQIANFAVRTKFIPCALNLFSAQFSSSCANTTFKCAQSMAKMPIYVQMLWCAQQHR